MEKRSHKSVEVNPMENGVGWNKNLDKEWQFIDILKTARSKGSIQIIKDKANVGCSIQFGRIWGGEGLTFFKFV